MKGERRHRVAADLQRRARRALSIGLLLTTAGILPAAAGWESKVRRVERLLQERDWKRAVEHAVRVRADMVSKISESRSSSRAVAEVLALQAIGEANLGRDRDALWHWHTAQNFIEDLDELDLSGFDRAAEILGGRSLHEVPEISETDDESNRHQRSRDVRIERTVEPDYPKALRKAGLEGAVEVRIIVGTDGRPHQPLLQETGLVPTMVFPALEALGEWRFRPAERDGVATPVYYEVRLYYE